MSVSLLHLLHTRVKVVKENVEPYEILFHT